MLAERIKGIGMSPTLRIADLATDLRARGEDVLDFSAGQPDFPTPEAVRLAGKRAIDEGRTRYTPNQGIRELREAIADALEREQRLQYTAEQVLVSPGAKALMK